MRKNIFVFMILGTCVSLPAFAYTIGNFVAPKGADGINGTNGTDCRPTETRTRCFGTGSDKCGDTTRSGVKIVTTQCDGSGSTTSYIYDNNCGITVASTTDVHQDNDATKPVTHKRVTFKNTCTNETLSTTADVPAGCTPAYTTKYINKAANGTYSYDNSSRSENTVGARTTVSGCGTDTTFDTYDGNDGTSFNYMGSVASCSALNNVSNPAQNDAYIVNGDGNGKLCIYNGSSWPTCPSGCAEFTGPAGDNNCTGFESSTTAVKNTLRTYSGPSNSTTSGGVTFYATRGKMVLTHKMCNTSLDDTVDSENDPCVPIIAPSGVTCNGTYMECKRGDNSSLYNVCEATTGTTFSSALSAAQSAAETAVAAVDPCASVANGTNTQKKAQIKSMNSTYTLQTVSNGNDRTAVGYSTVTKTTCATGADATQVEYQYDTCKEIADTRTSGACSGNDKVYLECVNQTKGASDSGYTYKVCQTVAENTSLSGKITAAQTAANSKIDASYLTNNGYLTSNSDLNAGKLTGKINSDQLPTNVVTTTNGKIDSNVLPASVVTTDENSESGLDKLLGEKNYVTENSLTSAVNTAISAKEVTFGSASITLDEALELLSAAAGTCTRTTGFSGSSENSVTCSGGALGNVSTRAVNNGN